MTKKELMRHFYFCGNVDLQYLSNVIVGHHTNPTKKLRNLKNLTDTGHEISIQQFQFDRLTIDGENGYRFRVLETGTIQR